MPRTTATQRAKIRRASRQREPDPSEEAGELNIVPLLDIVVNLMLFMLATTAAVIATAETGAELPGMCRGADCPEPRPSIHLSVTVGHDNILVAAEGGRLAPGCEDVGGAGPTVTGHDWAALGACLQRVHERFPEETSLILSADPTVPYEEIIHAMDAAHGPPETPRFRNVRLSAGVR